MGPITQLSFDQLPAHLQLKLKGLLQDNEKTLLCCYRKMDPEELYVLTNFRVIKFFIKEAWKVKKFANTNLTDVHYSDIVNITDRRYAGIPILDPEFFIISIFGQDQQQPIILFHFNKMDEVYTNFLAILRRKITDARMVGENEKGRADKASLDRLTELKVLLENKLISHDEYTRLREAILKEI